MTDWPKSGKNAYGSWIQFEDGVMHCWVTGIVITATAATFASGLWVLPKPFIDSDGFATMTMIAPGGFSGSERAGIQSSQIVNGGSHVSLGIASPGSFTIGDTMTVNGFASGWWKAPPAETQSNFVNSLRNNTRVRGIYVSRVSGVFHVGLSWAGGGVTEFLFRMNDDGLWLLRGVRVGPENASAPLIGTIKPLDASAAVPLVPANTILDFAIAERPAGTGVEKEWVPQHGTQSGVSGNISRVVMIDGNIAPSSDFSAIAATKFSIDQSFDAMNPHAPGVQWRHHVDHEISITAPLLHIKNNPVDFVPTEVSAMYLGMGAAVPANVSALYLDDGTVISPVPANGTSIELPVGVKSAAYLRTDSGVSYAVAVHAPGVVHDGAPGQITFRTDGVSKVYWDATGGTTISAGASYEADQYLMVTSGPSAAISASLATD